MDKAKRLWSRDILSLWRVDMDYGDPSFHIFIESTQVLLTFNGGWAIAALTFLRKCYQI